MLARQRQVRARKVRVLPLGVVCHPAPFGKHAVPAHILRHAILHLAGKSARLTANAARLVNGHSVSRHDFTYAFSTSTNTSL